MASASNEDELANTEHPADLVEPSQSQSNLTQEQLDRIETNRKRALEIRDSKKNSKLPKITLEKKLVDSGAGFYVEEEEFVESQRKEPKLVETPPIPQYDEQPVCLKCEKTFAHSFLSINFDLNVCDSCKVEHTEEFKLIARTDAKAEFLLKDCDFDFREPPLKFIVRKNPHKRFGEMKLYLRCQCQQRAMIVHEDEEKLEEKKEIKIHNLHQRRQKNYEKKIKELRKDARQGAKQARKFHEHEYGEEVYDEKKDIYYKTCKTCSFKLEYEEL